MLLRYWDGIGDFLIATIQLRGKTWRVIFSHDRQLHFLTIGKVSETEAKQWKSRVELLLMRLKQRFVEIPAGVTIADFVLHDGKLHSKAPIQMQPTESPISKRDALSTLKDAYGDTVKEGHKAITIPATSNRRKADVIVAMQYRRYLKFNGTWDQDYVEAGADQRRDLVVRS